MTRHPRARPPSPFAAIPTGPRWYAQVAEYQRGTPTLGVMSKENTMQILWCRDGSAGEFAPGSGAPCARCRQPAWMHWTVRP